MRILDGLRARDPRGAAHSAVLILLVCAGVSAALPLTQAGSEGGPALGVHLLAVAVLVPMAAVCAATPPERLDRWGALVVIALGGVVLISTMNLLTEDSTAGAQAFFGFPVLWAASQMRPAAVVLVTGAALAGDAVTVVALQSLETALADFVFLGALLVVPALTLARANGAQERLVAALRRQARVDSLTGLVNRHAFEEELRPALPRPDEVGTALVLVDVDSFKSINDGHGHPVGDDALVHLAEVLRAQGPQRRRRPLPARR